MGGTARSQGAGAPGRPSNTRTDSIRPSHPEGANGGSPAPLASQFKHQPVLLEESLSWLALDRGALVVDGTVGGGGHAAAILERTAPQGRLIALDVDADALKAAAQ